MRSPTFIALALCLGAAAPGWALTDPSPAAQAVLACQTVRGDNAQLACFRRAAAALAGDLGSAVGASSAEAQAAPPFGAHEPRARQERPVQPRSAELVLRSLGDMGDGRAILIFEDGSTWVEAEAEPITSAVRPGQRLRLERGALGGYLLVLPHRAGIHVARLHAEGR